MCDKEEKYMPLLLDPEKKETVKVDAKKFKSKVPHLRMENGVIILDENDPLQKRWGEEFKK